MMKTWSCAGIAALLAGAAVTLAACDGGSASTAARDHTSDAGASTTVATADTSHYASNDRETSDRDNSGAEDARRAPVPLVDGKPMWAANRRHSAEENANYQFQRDGADFGAHDLNDFVAKAHAFITSSPSNLLTLTRHNGDRLLYDPKRNIFAVVTKDGAPRTMFKPNAGKAYWDQQVARQAQGDDQSNRSDRTYSRGSHDSGSPDDQG